jgi:ABC-type uncharacterized transport system auxiliary subunit
MMKRKLAIGALLAGAINLGGCLSLLLPDPAPAEKIYRLSPDLQTSVTAAQAYGAKALTIRVDRPNAPKALQGYDLAVSPDAKRIAKIAGAKWEDSLPTLVQKAFVFELNSRPDLVGLLPTSGARTTYRAHLTIRHFEAQFDRGAEAAPNIVIDYLLTLSDAGSRELIGTQSFHIEQRAATKKVSDIVTSKSAANSAILKEISDWMTQKLSNTPS